MSTKQDEIISSKCCVYFKVGICPPEMCLVVEFEQHSSSFFLKLRIGHLREP